MFSLAIAYCLASELPTTETCRVETLPYWFQTEEACVTYLSELNNSQYVIVDARCNLWASMEGLVDDPV